MTDPTTTDPPRWRLVPVDPLDEAPTAFPMSDDDETACLGDDAGFEGIDGLVLPPSDDLYGALAAEPEATS